MHMYITSTSPKYIHMILVELGKRFFIGKEGYIDGNGQHFRFAVSFVQQLFNIPNQLMKVGYGCVTI